MSDTPKTDVVEEKKRKPRGIPIETATIDHVLPTVYVLGMSGGKDSSAVWLWYMNESGLPKDRLHITFNQTYNEDPVTLAHIKKISDKSVEWGGPPVIELEPALGFLDLAIKKKRFPSTKRRFCTQHLKMFPSQKYVLGLMNQGLRPILLTGVRANESFERSKLTDREFDLFYCAEVWRPILKWTLADVVAIHKKYDFPLNPLYAMGATRVGCFPCINSSKKELRAMAKYRPERIDELRKWETMVKPSRDSMFSSFFPRNKVPLPLRSKEVTTASGEKMMVATIDDVVLWSKTERGGKQFSFDLEPEWTEDKFIACNSSMGACE